MSSTLEFGKKILMKRMIEALEKEGYKVEFAPDYEGFIIADRRDDPNIFLLAANTIEQLRFDYAGKPGAFLDAVLKHVRHNISIGMASVPPQPGVMPEGGAHRHIPGGPPPLKAIRAREQRTMGSIRASTSRCRARRKGKAPAMRSTMSRRSATSWMTRI